jgi:hypothetical protein
MNNAIIIPKEELEQLKEKVVLILFAGSHDDAAAFLRGKS